MKILITGGCGFVGSNLAVYLKEKLKKAKITTLDNLCRKGSKLNRARLKFYNIKNLKIDISDNKKIKKLPKYNLVIDCCAEAAIEASKLDSNNHKILFGTFFKIFIHKSKIIGVIL